MLADTEVLFSGASSLLSPPPCSSLLQQPHRELRRLRLRAGGGGKNGEATYVVEITVDIAYPARTMRNGPGSRSTGRLLYVLVALPPPCDSPVVGEAGTGPRYAGLVMR